MNLHFCSLLHIFILFKGVGVWWFYIWMKSYNQLAIQPLLEVWIWNVFFLNEQHYSVFFSIVEKKSCQLLKNHFCFVFLVNNCSYLSIKSAFIHCGMTLQQWLKIKPFKNQNMRVESDSFCYDCNISVWWYLPELCLVFTV